jgi:hypothetical protein
VGRSHTVSQFLVGVQQLAGNVGNDRVSGNQLPNLHCACLDCRRVGRVTFSENVVNLLLEAGCGKVMVGGRQQAKGRRNRQAGAKELTEADGDAASNSLVLGGNLL